MQPHDQPARDVPAAASGAATPARVPRRRAVVDFRPYPTASTRTRRSPANSRRGDSHRDTGRGERPPTPCTIWFTPDPSRHEFASLGASKSRTVDAGAVPSSGPSEVGPDTDPTRAGWWLPVLPRAVTSFTDPGATVLLLPWPAPAGDGCEAWVPAAAVIAVTRLGRRPCLGHLPEPPRLLNAGSSGPDGTDRRADFRGALDGADLDRADLLITVMPARDDAAEHTDAVARLAARALCLGGVLAVLTHSDRSGEALLDPTGPMVTAGQNADLLYLQHIVAVHLPPADLRRHGAHRVDADDPVTRPHRRVHSDVLVFTQPHDHTAHDGTAGSDGGDAPLP